MKHKRVTLRLCGGPGSGIPGPCKGGGDSGKQVSEDVSGSPLRIGDKVKFTGESGDRGRDKFFGTVDGPEKGGLIPIKRDDDGEVNWVEAIDLRSQEDDAIGQEDEEDEEDEE